MAYCSEDDLAKLLPEEILVQLTDDAGIGVTDSERIAEAIETAGAEIDGWCAPRYAVPFADPVPALIKKCAIDVAIYNLYSRRVETIPETRASRYREAMQLLKGIASGAVELVAAAGQQAAMPSMAEVFGPGRLFTRDTP